MTTFTATADLSSSLVAVAPASPTAGLTLHVTAGDGGACFAQAAPFPVLLQSPTGRPTKATAELADVASVVGDVVTLANRGQYGTSAQPVAVGWVISAPLTAEMVQAIQAAVAANASAVAANTTAIAGKVGTGDARLSDARTPTAHKTSHATGGSDVLLPSDIGADPAGAASSAVSTHVAAVDPHGDRAFASNALSSALAGLSPAEFPAATQGSGLTHSGVGQTVGGVVVTAGMRILDTANAVSAGLWVAAAGAWTRPADFATGSDARGKLVEVDGGTLWLSVGVAPVTVDTTPQVWTRLDVGALTKGLVLGTGLAAVDLGAAQNLARVGPVTGATTAAAGQNIAVDISTVSSVVTVPAGLPVGSRIMVKIVKVSGTVGSTNMTVQLSGSEVFNVAGGVQVTTPKYANGQGVILQLDGTVWTVQSTDTPLAVALGAAQTGSDNTLGGLGGTPFNAVVASKSQQALGNLGATPTLTLTTTITQATGTLNANCALAIAGLTAGAQAILLLTQDATGGRTLSVNGATVTVPKTALASFEVTVFCPDGTNLYVTPPVTGATAATSSALGTVQLAGDLAGAGSAAGAPKVLGLHPDVQVFSASAAVQTWTKPTWATIVDVTLCQPGGGGGSGARGAAGTVRAGGGGGGGGGIGFHRYRALALGATESLMAGVGGAGGTAVTTDNTSGVQGQSGVVNGANVSWFRNTTFSETAGPQQGFGGSTLQGNGGVGGVVSGASGTPGGSSSVSAAGLAGGLSSSGAPHRPGLGGGGGGTITAANAATSGGTGGQAVSALGLSAAGGTAGAASSAGGAGGAGGAGVSPGNDHGGTGGGGGGAGDPGAAAGGGAGGAGGFPGGGGGGGGASANGQASGAGGAGGDGLVIVVSW